jgi:hypothetical protein
MAATPTVTVAARISETAATSLTRQAERDGVTVSRALRNIIEQQVQPQPPAVVGDDD